MHTVLPFRFRNIFNLLSYVCLTYCHLKIPFSDVPSGRDGPDAPGPEAGSLVHQKLQSQILQQQHIHSIEN